MQVLIKYLLHNVIYEKCWKSGLQFLFSGSAVGGRVSFNSIDDHDAMDGNKWEIMDK